jgi:hypothetical protein
MSFLSRNGKHDKSKPGYGFFVASSEAPRLRISPETVARIEAERALRAETRAAARGRPAAG